MEGQEENVISETTKLFRLNVVYDMHLKFMLFISMHDTYRPNKVIKINGNMFIHCECARNNVSQ